MTYLPKSAIPSRACSGRYPRSIPYRAHRPGDPAGVGGRRFQDDATERPELMIQMLINTLRHGPQETEDAEVRSKLMLADVLLLKCELKGRWVAYERAPAT